MVARFSNSVLDTGVRRPYRYITLTAMMLGGRYRKEVEGIDRDEAARRGEAREASAFN